MQVAVVRTTPAILEPRFASATQLSDGLSDPKPRIVLARWIAGLIVGCEYVQIREAECRRV